MKKIFNMCRQRRRPHTDSEPLIATPIEMRSPELPDWPKIQTLHVRKRDNAFTIAEVRFSPDDVTHRVEISFDKEGGTMMKLAIDGEAIYKVDTRLQFRGNFAFKIDGKVVDFLWDVIELPMKFSFSTRAGDGGGYDGGGGGGGYGGSGEGGEGEWQGKQWEDYEECSSLMIFGI